MEKFKNIEVVLFGANGNIDPVEIDGVKYEANPEKPEEALKDDKGELVKFVEPAPSETEEEKKAREKKEEDDKNLSKKSIEELAKTNPEVAKLLDDQRKAKEAEEKRIEKAKKDKDKKDEEDGKWEQLAKSRLDEIDQGKKELDQKKGVLEKYKTSIGSVLKSVTETIPEEKRGLVPADFSERQKLEYIIANAKILGATVTNVSKKIDKSDGTPILTDEGTLIKEINALTVKKDKTSAELDILFEKSQKLKALRLTRKS